jgi:hypothetical protein
MRKEIKCTNNILADVINWLKDGDIVCLFYSRKGENIGKFYFSQEKLEKITDERIIYVNISSDPSLLDKDEYPSYIEESGFVEYKSTDILPENHDNIHHFSLNYDFFENL